MSYVEKHLIEGEKIIFKTRLHWIVLVVPALLALLFAGLGIYLLVRANSADESPNAAHAMLGGGAIFLVIAVIFLARGILRRNSTQMTVTNMRVVANVGIAARRSIEIFLSRVESIGVEESVMGRMLGYGTVIVRGTGGTPESFDLIARPLEFRTNVQQQIEAAQAKLR